MLIAIEGIDGAGKTTLARRLATTLEAAGARVVLSKEPTNGPWGTQLRQSAATGRLSAEQEAELLIRDRHEHVDTLIAPALARGDIVILDRYFPSMVAYQGAAGLPLDELLERNAFAPRPDVLLQLDLPPAHRPGPYPRPRRCAQPLRNPGQPGTLPRDFCRAGLARQTRGGRQCRCRQRAAPGPRHHRGRIGRPIERRCSEGRHRQGRTGTALGRSPGLIAAPRIARSTSRDAPEMVHATCSGDQTVRTAFS
ncbi:UNVERIFIED_ORG: hypothetical protein ABIB63_001500 [Xanthomonas axonopodis]